jgi:hypothetical protein
LVCLESIDDHLGFIVVARELGEVEEDEVGIPDLLLEGLGLELGVEDLNGVRWVLD